MAREIFISYSRWNLDKVKTIKRDIEQATDVECWMDLNAIESGATQFTQDIVDGIKSCRVFLFMLSKESQVSKFALRELNFAMKKAEMDKQKHVVIVNIDDCHLIDEFEFMYGLTDTILWSNIPQRTKLIKDLKKWGKCDTTAIRIQTQVETSPLSSNVKQVLVLPESQRDDEVQEEKTKEVLTPENWLPDSEDANKDDTTSDTLYDEEDNNGWYKYIIVALVLVGCICLFIKSCLWNNESEKESEAIVTEETDTVDNASVSSDTFVSFRQEEKHEEDKKNKKTQDKKNEAVSNPHTTSIRTSTVGDSKVSLQTDSSSTSPMTNDVVEIMPSFPGGQTALLAYLEANIKYPNKAEENGIQGRVVVCFIVEKDGSLSNVKVVKSIDPLLDKEAVRVVKGMPKWNPGKQDGNVVRVKYTVPITFRLQ